MTDTCPNCTRVLQQLADILAGQQTRTKPEPVAAFNHVRDFINGGHVWFVDGVRTTVEDIYQAYIDWCVLSDPPMNPIGKNRFGTAMTALGFPAIRGTAGIRLRVGITNVRPPKPAYR